METHQREVHVTTCRGAIRPISRATLRQTVVYLGLCCSLAACATMGQKPVTPDLTPWPELRTDVQMERLRTRLNEYAITFAADVDLTASSIEQHAPDLMVRRNALTWRLRAIPEMHKAAFRTAPIGALIDVWILAVQMEQLLTVGDGRDAFGGLQPEAVAVAHRLVEQVREIGASVSVSADARNAFEQKVVTPWVQEHPLRDLTFVRESPIGRFAEQTAAAGNILQSVGSMEQVVSSLALQARIYMADLPRQARGEVDLLRTDVLTPDGIASLQADLHVSATAADRLATTAEGVPELVSGERQAIIDELIRQRAMVMEGLSDERRQAIGALTSAIDAERSRLMRDLDSQRLATLAWATDERREAAAALHGDIAGAVQTMRRERAAALDDARKIIDGVMLRLALFILAAVILAPIVAHAYVRVWPRPRP